MKIQSIELKSNHQSNLFKAICHIQIDHQDAELWFEMDNKNINNFCQDRIDGIVTMLLLRCMANGENIYSDIPISAKLHHQLTSQLIPILSTYSNGKLKEIHINAPLTTQIYAGNKVAGTGMSCGVDSMYTVMKYSDETIDERFRVQELLVAQTDSVTTKHEYSDRYVTNCHRAMEFAKEYGYSCLCINTNFRDFYGSDHIQYTDEVTFMMCGLALLFSKLFGVYYFSGSREINHLTIEPPKSSESYNLVILPLLCTENLSFYLGGFCGRLQKERELSKYKPSYKYLNVCWHYSATEHLNCGECGKCKKTLLSFDLIGCLDKYSNIFKLNNYYKARNNIWANLIAGNTDSISEKEVYEAAIKANFVFPKESLKIAKTKIKKQNRQKLKLKFKEIFVRLKRILLKYKRK